MFEVDIKIKLAILLITTYFLGKLIIVNKLGMKNKVGAKLSAKDASNKAKEGGELKSQKSKKPKKYRKTKIFLTMLFLFFLLERQL